MSDDTRYPCCPDRPVCGLGVCGEDHERPCAHRYGCPGSVPVGPTKEGKQ